jgi:hypothetical protein
LGKSFQPIPIASSSSPGPGAGAGEYVYSHTELLQRLRVVCQASREVLMKFVKKDVNLKSYPGAIQIHIGLFARAGTASVNGASATAPPPGANAALQASPPAVAAKSSRKQPSRSQKTRVSFAEDTVVGPSSPDRENANASAEDDDEDNGDFPTPDNDNDDSLLEEDASASTPASLKSASTKNSDDIQVPKPQSEDWAMSPIAKSAVSPPKQQRTYNATRTRSSPRSTSTASSASVSASSASASASAPSASILHRRNGKRSHRRSSHHSSHSQVSFSSPAAEEEEDEHEPEDTKEDGATFDLDDSIGIQDADISSSSAVTPKEKTTAVSNDVDVPLSNAKGNKAAKTGTKMAAKIITKPSKAKKVVTQKQKAALIKLNRPSPTTTTTVRAAASQRGSRSSTRSRSNHNGSQSQSSTGTNSTSKVTPLSVGTTTPPDAGDDDDNFDFVEDNASVVLSKSKSKTKGGVKNSTKNKGGKGKGGSRAKRASPSDTTPVSLSSAATTPDTADSPHGSPTKKMRTGAGRTSNSGSTASISSTFGTVSGTTPARRRRRRISS